MPTRVRVHIAGVVSFDYNAGVNLTNLPSFVASHGDAAAILMDWRHWLGFGCTGRNRSACTALTGVYTPRPATWPATQPVGFECMAMEMHAVLSRHGPLHCFISSDAARAAALHTYEDAQRLELAHRRATGGKASAFPHYFDMRIFLRRGAAHPSAPALTAAFRDVLRDSASVERDQLLVPLHLARHHLYPHIVTTNQAKLATALGYAGPVSSHRHEDHHHHHNEEEAAPGAGAGAAAGALLPPGRRPHESDLPARVTTLGREIDAASPAIMAPYTLPKLNWTAMGHQCDGPQGGA